jgi:hypothetical protein
MRRCASRQETLHTIEISMQKLPADAWRSHYSALLSFFSSDSLGGHSTKKKPRDPEQAFNFFENARHR